MAKPSKYTNCLLNRFVKIHSENRGILNFPKLPSQKDRKLYWFSRFSLCHVNFTKTILVFRVFPNTPKCFHGPSGIYYFDIGGKLSVFTAPRKFTILILGVN